MFAMNVTVCSLFPPVMKPYRLERNLKRISQLYHAFFSCLWRILQRLRPRYGNSWDWPLQREAVQNEMNLHGELFQAIDIIFINQLDANSGQLLLISSTHLQFPSAEIEIKEVPDKGTMLFSMQEDEDGKPYKCKHAFNCPSQLNDVKAVLQEMATRPEEYIFLDGRITINIPEGYHGIALAYRGKRIDLGSLHYQCKTNMSIPHKIIIC